MNEAREVKCVKDKLRIFVEVSEDIGKNIKAKDSNIYMFISCQLIITKIIISQITITS
jgi:hypothetical protein